MHIHIKFLLTLSLLIFFIACEDVNTLCVNESNQTLDSNESNESDSNSSVPDDNASNSDDNTTLSEDTQYTKSVIDEAVTDFNTSVSDFNTTLSYDSDTTNDVNDTKEESDDENETLSYIQHNNIVADIFWIGEEDNSSSWDSDWVGSYGGVDTPDERDVYHPITFTPTQNPFYVALPYNDLGSDGQLKSDISDYIPWANPNDTPTQSICKNRWLKISANRKDAYGQWEDVGPVGDNDINYLFDTSKPLSSPSISLSPAIRDYLGIDANSSVNWVFVDDEDVPDGPWRDIVTRSNSK